MRDDVCKIYLFIRGRDVVDDERESIEKIESCIVSLSDALILLKRRLACRCITHRAKKLKRSIKLKLIKGGKN